MRLILSRASGISVVLVVLALTGCGGGGSQNQPSPPVSTVTSLSVSCSPAAIESSQTSQCEPIVNGTGNYSSAVTWTVSAGTISSSGLYTSPAVTVTTQVAVTVTSVQDPSKKSDPFTVTINPTAAPSFLSISNFTLNGLGQKIDPIDLSVYVTGGTTPYTFAIVAQTLTDSTVASLNGSQLIGGYSYHVGTNTVTLSATDANQKSAQTTVQIIVTVPTVTYQLFMLDYSPYVGTQNPNDGTIIDDDQLIQQIGAIAPYTMGIRTFSSTHGLQDVPEIAKRFGLKIYQGVWISNDLNANNEELQSGITVAQTVGVDAMIIGSEALLRNDVTPAQLTAYIDEFRAAVPGIPVSAADQYLPLENNPSVVADCDFVFANFYPFWEGVDISKAVATLGEEYRLLQATYLTKEVIVSETGWKSFGDSVGSAAPSPANAQLYFLNFESWAQAEHVKTAYFEDHDEPWKALGSPPDDGWGIWDQNLVMKPGMAPVFGGATTADNWSCQVVPGGSGTPTLQFTSVPAIGSSALLQGQEWHADPESYFVVVYIHVGQYGWWVKPYANEPLTSIACDGSWSANIVTGGSDASADQIAAFLIPASYGPPVLTGAGALPQDLYTNSVANVTVTRQ